MDQTKNNGDDRYNNVNTGASLDGTGVPGGGGEEVDNGRTHLESGGTVGASKPLDPIMEQMVVAVVPIADQQLADWWWLRWVEE